MNLNALCFFRRKRWKAITKTLMIMKLTAIILLGACLQVSANGLAQKVTLSEKNVPLQKIFKQIHNQTGFQFFYEDQLLDKAGKISIEVKDASVEEALNLCFQNIPLIFSIVDKTIVVKEKTEVTGLIEEATPPPLEITGIVKDENGAPVAGVSVIIKGTKRGTTTNENGYFSLADVKKDAILVLSATNIETKEISVAGNISFDIRVKTKVSPLDELQIIGYGKTSKRLSTSNIGTIKADVIQAQPVTNFTQALQGQLPGITIDPGGGINGTGAIGSAPNIFIRGISTFTGNTYPLIIVDGVIINNDQYGLETGSYWQQSTNITGGYTTTGGGSNILGGVTPLNSINPNDVESIDILKDADATSIYGSRGSNGVILITTKKAKIGKTKLSVNAYTGQSTPTYITPRMNTQQYLQMRQDAFAMGNVYTDGSGTVHAINPITPTLQNAQDLVKWSPTAYTNWPKWELGNTAPIYNVDANLSGGTKGFNFFWSAGYFKQYDMQYLKPYQERLSSHLNLRHSSADNKLNIDINGNFEIDNQNTRTTSLSRITPVTYRNPPNFELYNPDGTINFPNTVTGVKGNLATNPIPSMALRNFAKTYNTLLSADISYRLYKGLSIKTLVSFNRQNNSWENIVPSGYFAATRPDGSTWNPQDVYTLYPNANFTTRIYTSVNAEPQLTYTGKILRGKIDALAGATYLQKQTDASVITVNNPGNDALLHNPQSSNPPATVQMNTQYYKFNSIFGRVNYNWENKYILNLNYRRDGSSRFGPDNRFANFYSAGAAWLFSSEKFVQKAFPFLSFGKLRGSYGTTGTDNIGDYKYASLVGTTGTGFTSYSYGGIPGLGPMNATNPIIKWEQSNKLDMSLDLGFLDDRFLFNVTYYNNVATNLLTALTLTAQTGFASGYTGNFKGTIRNRGWEFEVTTNNLNEHSKIQWQTRFNLSINQNKLIKYPGLEGSQDQYTLKIGRAITYDNMKELPYILLGIDPATGLPQYNVKGGGKTPAWPADYGSNDQWQGSAMPNDNGGLTNMITYKGFSLNIFIQFAHSLMSNWHFMSSYPLGEMWNPPTAIIGNYWKKPGDIAKYPRLFTGQIVPGQNDNTNNSLLSYYYPYPNNTDVQQGMYFRLKNVQLQYTFPKKIITKAKMSNLLVYIRGENLAFMNTGPKLWKDPELWSAEAAPFLKTWTAGINFSF